MSVGDELRADGRGSGGSLSPPERVLVSYARTPERCPSETSSDRTSNMALGRDPRLRLCFGSCTISAVARLPFPTKSLLRAVDQKLGVFQQRIIVVKRNDAAKF